MTISTHVLDAVTGRPAPGMRVTLTARRDGTWTDVSHGETDTDGRLKGLASDAAGDYRLTFDTGGYLAETFYPEVVLTFRVLDPGAHHHVPLLLSPYAYSTYRGS